MRSSNLTSCLCTFQKAVDDELSKGKLSVSLLGELFLPIARHLICRGHFEVSCGGKIYRHIYPVTVEFYFHEEGKGEGKIKDYIVYHRNKDKTPEEYLEAYPLGSINTHVSGIDITFEDQTPQPRYRASALIRAFRAEELIHTSGLTECQNAETRSTYLYEQLFMGLPINEGINIKWVDDNEKADSILNRGYRINVHKYDLDKTGKPVKREKKDYPEDYLDKKAWAFSLEQFKKQWELDDKEEK